MSADRQKAYRKRLQARGLVAVTEWVPFGDRKAYKDMALQLRMKAGLSKYKKWNKKGCTCTMTQSMIGDGCSICNPGLYAEMIKELDDE